MFLKSSLYMRTDVDPLLGYKHNRFTSEKRSDFITRVFQDSSSVTTCVFLDKSE